MTSAKHSIRKKGTLNLVRPHFFLFDNLVFA